MATCMRRTPARRSRPATATPRSFFTTRSGSRIGLAGPPMPSGCRNAWRRSRRSYAGNFQPEAGSQPLEHAAFRLARHTLPKLPPAQPQARVTPARRHVEQRPNELSISSGHASLHWHSSKASCASTTHQLQQEGLDLIVLLRKQGNTLPIVVYGGSRALGRRDELVRAGATFVTNRPTEVFNMAVDVLTGRA